MRRSIVSATLALLLVAGSAQAQGAGRWETRAPMLSLRTEVAGALLTGKIYVIGGLVPDGASGRVDEYDVATNTWRVRAPLPVTLHHTAAAVAGGRLFVIGGFGLDGWR